MGFPPSPSEPLSPPPVCSSADRAEATTQDVDPALGLSGRSQAMGAVLCVLLAVLVACLLGLLLYKRERR